MAESAGGKLIGVETKKLKRELTLLPLFGLIYFTVCGGSFGIEGLISASGPGLALVLIALTPLVFSLPNVLMVRELNSLMPVEGGYYHWIKRAFGPFAGFMAGWNNWVVSWLDVSIYPVLAATYLAYFIPVLNTGTNLFGVDLSGDFLRWVVSAVLIWAISLMQIRGARLSGLFTNVLGVVMIVPLLLLSILGLASWAMSGTTASIPFMPQGQNLLGALSTGLFIVMWNFMGWELPTAAGDEIVNPKKTYPRAMALVLVATILTYALPVTAGMFGGAGGEGRWQLWGADTMNGQIGIVSNLVSSDVIDADIEAAAQANNIAAEDVTVDELTSPEVAAAKTQISTWGGDPAATSGWEFPQIGESVGIALGSSGLGKFMGVILTIAAVLSMLGLFIGNSLGGSRIPFALAEDGMFPRFMVRVHGQYGTPWFSIVIVGVIFSVFSLSAFSFLVVADVFLQMLVILAEFAALWKLRFSEPSRPRQAVPGGIFGLVLVTVGPTAIILLAIVSQYVSEGFSSIGWALAFIAVGALLYVPFRRFLKPGVPDVDPYHSSGDAE